MNRCAAGNELPKQGPCPTCGATSGEPCPEAFRIAREERDSMVKELQELRAERDYWKNTVRAVTSGNHKSET